ncbi:MAG: helix-turn-helix transcriptional regulator [Clostridia bacterium]|nr:helix-turn-helix transcriptional regulator [Clostridia bacterium]
MKKFAERLIELRKEYNISQKAFANAIGVGQATVSEWENGIYEPTASAVRAIAKFFNVSADYLLQIDDLLKEEI